MSKYTFICEYTDLMTGDTVGEKITHEVRAESLTSVIESFERFLKGAGFVFNGQLDIVNEEEYSNHDEDQDEEEPHEWVQDKRADSEWPFASFKNTQLYDSKDVMPMPGTIGGAEVVLSNAKCKRCGLTKEQLGTSTCYDDDCGLNP